MDAKRNEPRHLCCCFANHIYIPSPAQQRENWAPPGARWTLSLRCWQFSFLSCFTNECGCLGMNFHFHTAHENGFSGYTYLTKEAAAWLWPQLIQTKKAEDIKTFQESTWEGLWLPQPLSYLHALSQVPHSSPYITAVIIIIAAAADTIGERWGGLYSALPNTNIITHPGHTTGAFVTASDSRVQRSSTGI